MRCKEYSDANSELFKEEYDEALYENTCEIEFCDRISVSLGSYAISAGRKMKFSEKLYWMAYYYTRHPKGRFELSHILQLLVFWAVCILVCEMVLYLWLNG